MNSARSSSGESSGKGNRPKSASSVSPSGMTLPAEEPEPQPEPGRLPEQAAESVEQWAQRWARACADKPGKCDVCGANLAKGMKLSGLKTHANGKSHRMALARSSGSETQKKPAKEKKTTKQGGSPLRRVAPVVLDTKIMRDVAGYVPSDIQDAVAEDVRMRSSSAAAESVGSMNSARLQRAGAEQLEQMMAEPPDAAAAAAAAAAPAAHSAAEAQPAPEKPIPRDVVDRWKARVTACMDDLVQRGRRKDTNAQNYTSPRNVEESSRALTLEGVQQVELLWPKRSELFHRVPAPSDALFCGPRYEQGA